MVPLFNRVFYRQTPAAFARSVHLLVLLACLAAIVQPAPSRLPGQTTSAGILGTWTGTSTCVGNRPACKNETVVYRCLPVEGHPAQVRVLADKIIDGKRIPMGALVFDYDRENGTARGEFERGRTHGIWSYSIVENTMKGTLVVLPEHSVARDVMVHRVTDDKVPAAPPISEYDQ